MKTLSALVASLGGFFFFGFERVITSVAESVAEQKIQLPSLRKIFQTGFCLAVLLQPLAQAAQETPKISLPPGFRAELVYKVPLEEQGSWVSLAVDDRGRLLTSDQNGSLYRIEPSPIGAEPTETRVERIDVDLGAAQGLLVHKSALYVVVSISQNGRKPGLYRVTDSDNDDNFDQVEKLLELSEGGEHGPHAVVLAPDGNSLYLCAGNQTKLPKFDSSRVPQTWGEDQLLPRIFDPTGQAVGIKAPGGWICKMDFDAKHLELVSVGYRNEYDLAVSAEGEIFTFDADMERDIGMPWFRPTRVCHVVSGSDFGWRTGNSKWPPYFPETLPPIADLGPGSPTGITFASETKFPEHYQKALFVGDWSYGNIYALHLQPQGSSYTATVEPFASAMPLPVTDIVVRPQDGAMYFSVGGRRTESALYRIVYDGQQRPAPQQPSISETVQEEAKQLRKIRHKLEVLHTASAPPAVDQIWPYLAQEDRFVRHAARVALEHQPVDSWRQRVLKKSNVKNKLRPGAGGRVRLHNRTLLEKDARMRLAALLALVRTAPDGAAPDLIDSLTSLDWNHALNASLQLELLRIAELILIRCDPVSPSDKRALTEYLSPRFPHGDHRHDRELSQLLVQLEAPTGVPRILEQLQTAVTSEQQFDFAIALSVAKNEWTLERRKQFFDWFQKIAASQGGNFSFGYIEHARDRFVESFSEEEKIALAEEINAPLAQSETTSTLEARPLVKKWTLDELIEQTSQNHQASASHAKSFQRGRRLFTAALCSTCHRMAGEGSSVGPDLTGTGGRLSPKDLLRAIVEPSYQISDQYHQMVFETGGRVLVGRILNLSEGQIYISTNMADPKTLIIIKTDEIDDQYPSDISIMPAGLLDTFELHETLDLMAYLRSGGNAEHQLYQGPLK